MHMRSAVVWAALLLSVMGGVVSLTHATIEVPFDAVVAGEPANLYAGAGKTFYTVGRLQPGSRVTVEEIIFGWHKVPSPPGTCSYIEADLVERRGDADTAVVTARRAAVKAGSTQGPAQSYRRQLDLLKGDRVRILGQDGSHYKIVPPRGAYVFLPPGSVQRARAEEPRTTAPSTGPRENLPTVGLPPDPGPRRSQPNSEQDADALDPANDHDILPPETDQTHRRHHCRAPSNRGVSRPAGGDHRRDPGLERPGPASPTRAPPRRAIPAQ